MVEVNQDFAKFEYIHENNFYFFKNKETKEILPVADKISVLYILSFNKEGVFFQVVSIGREERNLNQAKEMLKDMSYSSSFKLGELRIITGDIHTEDLNKLLNNPVSDTVAEVDALYYPHLSKRIYTYN